MFTPESQRLTKLCNALMHTKAEEVNCEEWLCRVAAFIEQMQAGQGGCQQLRAMISEHTSVCSECQEELEVLLEALCPQRAAEKAAEQNIRKIEP